jgi:hypothetical protein
MKKDRIIQRILSYNLLNDVLTTGSGQQHYNSFDGDTQRNQRKELMIIVYSNVVVVALGN